MGQAQLRPVLAWLTQHASAMGHSGPSLPDPEVVGPRRLLVAGPLAIDKVGPTVAMLIAETG